MEHVGVSSPEGELREGMGTGAGMAGRSLGLIQGWGGEVQGEERIRGDESRQPRF